MNPSEKFVPGDVREIGSPLPAATDVCVPPYCIVTLNYSLQG